MFFVLLLVGCWFVKCKWIYEVNMCGFYKRIMICINVMVDLKVINLVRC